MAGISFIIVLEPRTNTILFGTARKITLSTTSSQHYAHIEIYDHMHIRLPHHANRKKKNAKTGVRTLESLDNGVK